jgi:hypothetical protein
MVKIEKISNGYIASFKNTEEKTVKLFFPTIDTFADFLKEQLEPKKEDLK